MARVLAGKEYNILTATGGSDGLRTSRDFKGEIHLLLSDIQMPGMSGVDLAAAITRERPDLKVLLISGFTGEAPPLNEGWHFLSKPFLPSRLRG